MVSEQVTVLKLHWVLLNWWLYFSNCLDNMRYYDLYVIKEGNFSKDIRHKTKRITFNSVWELTCLK